MRVISKGKATGKEYGKIKSKQKLDRIQERKKQINRIENAKKNADRRKERDKKIIEKELIAKIEIVDFVKGNFIINKEGEEEKRVLKMPKNFDRENMSRLKDIIMIKVYGQEVTLREIKMSKDVFKKLIFHIEGLL